MPYGLSIPPVMALYLAPVPTATPTATAPKPKQSGSLTRTKTKGGQYARAQERLNEDRKLLTTSVSALNGAKSAFVTQTNEYAGKQAGLQALESEHHKKEIDLVQRQQVLESEYNDKQ
ncbi:hypothetical protein OQA88_4466 [Cercophora sp. LCS_1]